MTTLDKIIKTDTLEIQELKSNELSELNGGFLILGTVIWGFALGALVYGIMSSGATR